MLGSMENVSYITICTSLTGRLPKKIINLSKHNDRMFLLHTCLASLPSKPVWAGACEGRLKVVAGRPH